MDKAAHAAGAAVSLRAGAAAFRAFAATTLPRYEVSADVPLMVD